MISPAYIAPGTLPKPPSVTTTKAVSPNVSPTDGDHGYEIAIRAPAMPAPAAARPQASACIRSGRMPISIAALRSSATEQLGAHRGVGEKEVHRDGEHGGGDA